jgi:hypothetical protein
MTIREKLTIQKRRAAILATLGFALFAGGGFFMGSTHESLMWLIFVGFAMAGTGIVLILSIHCPKCPGRIGYVLNARIGSPFSVSRDFRFCPFCGVDLDSPLEDTKV